MVDNVGGCEFGQETRKKVESMYEMLVEVDKKASLSEVLLSRLEISNGQLIKAINQFSETIQEFKITMISIQNEIKNNATKTDGVKNKVDNIEKKIEQLEEKSKIDLLIIIKTIFTNRIIWLIGGGLLLYIIDFIIKFLLK